MFSWSGWIAGLGGTSGSAVFPFVTGAIANIKGIDVLQPMYELFILLPGGLSYQTLDRAVAMISSLVVLWAFIPTQKSRKSADIEVTR